MKINKLIIETPHLEEQFRFYQDILELDPTRISRDRFSVSLGYSVLEFVFNSEATPYHLAFHIPAYQELKALEWLRERTEIIRNGPDEIVDFSSWNAKSVYFYDADKNVLEFISRTHWPAAERVEFSGKSILGISEIGLATENVGQVSDFLQQHYGLEKFTGDYKVFCATGDEVGLFIVIDHQKKTWFPAGDLAKPSDFCAHFSIDDKLHRLRYEDGELQDF